MDLNLLRSAVTLLSFALFIAVVVWAFRRSGRARFAEAAQLPLVDDAAQPPFVAEAAQLPLHDDAAQLPLLDEAAAPSNDAAPRPAP